MKIIIEEIPTIDEIEIQIKCRSRDNNVDDIIRNLKLLDLNIVGFKDNENYMINSTDIFYFESVDEKIFCYTKDDVFETKYKLYELETILSATYFTRVSKATILNINKIKSFKSILSGRIECLLKNNEKVLISRMYVKDVKIKLGVIRGEK